MYIYICIWKGIHFSVYNYFIITWNDYVFFFFLDIYIEII